jgi:hypothetical protein
MEQLGRRSSGADCRNRFCTLAVSYSLRLPMPAVGTTPRRNFLPLTFEGRNPIVDRRAAIPLRKPRDGEEIVQLPIRQLREEVGEKLNGDAKLDHRGSAQAYRTPSTGVRTN